jgi:CBS domain-containing protein
MSTDVITVTPDTEIMRAVQILVDHDISGVPIVEERGQLVGILTERDCIEVAVTAGYFDEAGGRVRDYMTSPVETCQPTDSLMDVAARLITSRYRRYPVVEDARLIGLISRRDVLRALKKASWFSKPSSSIRTP